MFAIGGRCVLEIETGVFSAYEYSQELWEETASPRERMAIKMKWNQRLSERHDSGRYHSFCQLCSMAVSAVSPTGGCRDHRQELGWSHEVVSGGSRTTWPPSQV